MPGKQTKLNFGVVTSVHGHKGPKLRAKKTRSYSPIQIIRENLLRFI